MKSKNQNKNFISVNFTIDKDLLEKSKQISKKLGFASFSEYVREALRKLNDKK
jgi:metal-responsive CopG/Arc/MetJ family transcriptional regulator